MADHDPSRADRPGARRLDQAAVARSLRRMAAAAEPPWLHGEVARRLAERLTPMRAQPRRIVDWWAANGASAAVLRAACPKAERVAVEASAMVEPLGARAALRPWWSRLGAAAGTPLSDAAPDASIGAAQLVWANMALHLVRDPPALFARWNALLEVDGVVVFSCPGPATLRELRALYADCGWPAPTPEFVDMHDLGDMMVRAGFAEPVLDQETLTLRWNGAAALLAELRTLGGNTSPDRFGALRGPGWRERLLAALDERADADGGIAMSIEIAYGHGFKAAPRRAAGDPVAVPLEEMRAMVRRPPR